MCGCSSNFDGFNELDELEVSPYLDFDGEDMSIDEDFDYLFGKKGKEMRDRIKKRGLDNRKERLDMKAKRTTDYESCTRKKPLGVGRAKWNSLCRSVHPNDLSAGSNPAVDDTPAEIEEARKPSIVKDLTNVLKDKALGSENAGAGASEELMEEPKKAGILEKKGLLIAGGVILLGLGVFAIRKFRR